MFRKIVQNIERNIKVLTHNLVKQIGKIEFSINSEISTSQKLLRLVIAIFSYVQIFFTNLISFIDFPKPTLNRFTNGARICTLYINSDRSSMKIYAFSEPISLINSNRKAFLQIKKKVKCMESKYRCRKCTGSEKSFAFKI